MKYIEGLVSVVIPTHNRADLIGRAVDTALSQTYENIEVIVVSDGSDDNTDEIMHAYEANDKRVKYISYYPGQGGNHARNTGITNSSGEWVAFLDDDDEWHSDKIQKQIDITKSNNQIGLVCTAVNTVLDATGESSVYCPKPLLDSSKEILIRNCIGSTTTVMVKHELLDQCGMFDEKLKAMQDYDIWVRLCQITKIGLVEEPCVEYHNLAGNNQISWNYEKYASAAEYVNDKYRELRKSKLSMKEIRKIEAKSQLSIARKAFKRNDRNKTREYAKRAMKITFLFEELVYFVASVLPSSFVGFIFDQIS